MIIEPERLAWCAADWWDDGKLKGIEIGKQIALEGAVEVEAFVSVCQSELRIRPTDPSVDPLLGINPSWFRHYLLIPLPKVEAIGGGER